MNPALIALGVTILAWIGKGIWATWRGGKKEGMTEAQAAQFQKDVAALQELMEKFRSVTRQDIQDLYETISTHNDIMDERHSDFYKEFTDLRVKVASYTRDPNGGRHRA